MKNKQYYLNLILLSFTNDSTLTKAMKDIRSVKWEGKEKEAQSVILNIFKAFMIDENYVPYSESTIVNAASLLVLDHASPIQVLNVMNNRAAKTDNIKKENCKNLLTVATTGYKNNVDYLENLIKEKKLDLKTIESHYGIHAIQYDREPTQANPDYDKTAHIAIKLDKLKTHIESLQDRVIFLKEKENIRKTWLFNLEPEKKEILCSSGKEKEKLEILQELKELLI